MIHLMTVEDVARGKLERGKGQAACKPELFMVLAANWEVPRPVPDICHWCFQVAMMVDLVEWIDGRGPIASEPSRPAVSDRPREPAEKFAGPLPSWLAVVPASFERNEEDYRSHKHLPWRARKARRSFILPRAIPSTPAAWLEAIVREKNDDRIMVHDPLPVTCDMENTTRANLTLAGLLAPVEVEPIATDGDRLVVDVKTSSVLLQIAPRQGNPWPFRSAPRCNSERPNDSRRRPCMNSPGGCFASAWSAGSPW